MAHVEIQMTPSGATLAQQLEPSTPDDLADLIPRDARSRTFLLDADASSARAPLTFERLDARLRAFAAGARPGARVAVVMRGGADLAASLLDAMGGCAAVPLDPGATRDELRRALAALPCDCALVDAAAEGAEAVCAELGLPVARAAPRADAVDPAAWALPPSADGGGARDRRADAPALYLRTSGTTGRSKTVPRTRFELALGARAIAASLALGADGRADVALGFMPLYHLSLIHI